MKILLNLYFCFDYFRKKKLSVYASSLSIYFILSLFPTVMLVALLLNMFFLKTKYYFILIDELKNFINFNVNSILNLTISANLETFLRYGILGIVLTMLFSSIFIRGFFDTVLYIFDIENRKRKGKFIVSFFSIFIIVLMLIVLMILKTLMSLFVNYFDKLVNISFLSDFYIEFLYFLNFLFLLAGLLYLILKGLISFRNSLYMSFVVLVVLSIYSKIYFIIVNKAVYNMLYGSFSAIILTVVFLWSVFNIFLYILSFFYANFNFKKSFESYIGSEQSKLLNFCLMKIYALFKLKNYYVMRKDFFENFYELGYLNGKFVLNKNSCELKIFFGFN